MDNTTDYDPFDKLNMSTQTSKDEGVGIRSTVIEFGPAETVANYVLSLICVATVVSDSIALYVINRGRKFPRFCRILSMNYLISDMVGAVTYVFYTVLIYVCGYTNEIVIRSRPTCVGIFIQTSTAFIAGISLERVMSLVNHMTHTVPSRASHVAAIITTMWGFNVGTVITTILLMIGTNCQWELGDCNIYDVFEMTWFVSLTVILAYDAILIITSFIIQHFVRRHRAQILEQQSSSGRQTNINQRKQFNQEFETLKTIAQIIMSYLLLHIPISITLLLHEWYEDDYLPLRIAKCFSYLCLQISSFVHLYFYVFKLKENKVNMYILLSRVFNWLKPRAEQLRLELYNIPVVSDIPSRGTSSGDS